MKSGRISIARAMCLTAFLAFDFAWLRQIMDAWRWKSAFGFDAAPDMDVNGRVFDLGLFGMLNALAIGLFSLPLPDRDRRIRLLAFESCGLLVMGLYWSICWRWGAWILPLPRSRHHWGLIRVGTITNDAVRALGVDPKEVLRRLGNNIFVLIVKIATLTLPQFILTLVGARLIHRVARRWVPATHSSGIVRRCDGAA